MGWRMVLTRTGSRPAVAASDLVERAPAQGRDLDPVHEDLARVGAQQADEVLEEDRLSASAASDDDGDGAGGDLQGKRAQHRLAAEGLRERLDLNHSE